MRTLPSTSTEYIECTLEAFDPATNLPIDTSGDVVEVAFVGVGAKPVDADWKTGLWTAPLRAGILVGPASSTTLAVGDYDWWVRVTDSPERPTIKVDTLRVE